MIKAIFKTLYFDIRNFCESYFVMASRIIEESFLVRYEGLRKILSVHPTLIIIRYPTLFCLAGIYFCFWLLWIFLPLIISILLYYGRLF